MSELNLIASVFVPCRAPRNGQVDIEIIEGGYTSVDAAVLECLENWYDTNNDPAVIVITDDQARPYATIMPVEGKPELALVTYNNGVAVLYSVKPEIERIAREQLAW